MKKMAFKNAFKKDNQEPKVNKILTKHIYV